MSANFLFVHAGTVVLVGTYDCLVLRACGSVGVSDYYSLFIYGAVIKEVCWLITTEAIAVYLVSADSYSP